MSDFRSTSPLTPVDLSGTDMRLGAAETGRGPAPEGCRLPGLDALRELRPDADLLKENHIVGFRSNSAVSRPFNLLRSQITEACEQNGYSVLGVVSAVPHEGKSFIAANLAAALSRLPQLEVYLLDLDLRRPSIGGLFGIDDEQGLDAFFESGEPELAQVGRRVVGTNLGIFATAAATADVAGTLHGARFEGLMDDIRSGARPGRIVLCDLPPVFVGDDAMAVGRHLDAFIHVVGSGTSTTRQFEELRRLMKDTPCLGAVLNRYVGGPFDPYGYGRYSKAYDGYFSDPD
ncbi:MAG TPA: CpsD/CapB family tyrosine-protein kinase [Novosphingobium sp.]|nr:CpsD/CapB family tyrosine-protein kinase [Novosphingobium sp.]